jgi:hypothetical protein
VFLRGSSIRLGSHLMKRRSLVQILLPSSCSGRVNKFFFKKIRGIVSRDDETSFDLSVAKEQYN